MRISVCAISKNEENKVEEWFENLKGCDDFYVLDTGSSDNTILKLKNLGVKVSEKSLDPFDFSRARNCSLELVENSDWLVSIDFDEKLEENWRNKVEQIVEENPKITAITVDEGEVKRKYLNIPDIDKKIKIFKKGYYMWNSPVHEHLLPIKDGSLIYESNIKLYHRPSVFDDKKEKFYYEIAKKAIENGDVTDWLVWFCLNYCIKIQDKENIIKYSIQYLNLTQKTTTDFRILCMTRLSEYLPYEQGVFYLLRSFIEYPCENSFFNLIKYGIKNNKPELVLFLNSLYKSKDFDLIKKEAMLKIMSEI